MKYILLISLFIFGCSPSSQFTTKQVIRLPADFNIRIIGLENENVFEENREHVGGTAVFWKNPCEITVTKPRYPNDKKAFCTVGHEVWHCLTGHFHKGYEVSCD